MAGLIVAVGGWAVRPAPAAAHPEFGVLSATCAPDQAPAERRAGVTLAVLAVRWDRFEPEPGQFDTGYLDQTQRRVGACLDSGLRVVLSPGLQYPPEWVHQLPAADFRDQRGNPAVDGSVNLVFSQAVRDAATGYLRQLNHDIALQQFAAVRIGTTSAGELGYPLATAASAPTAHSYWAFDDSAQTGRGLPAGMLPSPLPGWLPGNRIWRDRPVTVHDATTWWRWYQNSLTETVIWQIRTLRELGYAGPLHLPLSGRGVLPQDKQAALAAHLDGTADPNGTLERGTDYRDQLSQLARLPEPAHGPLTVDVTGIDDTSTVTARAAQPPQDICTPDDPATITTANPPVTQWPSWRWTIAVARHNRLGVLGENPGPPTEPNTGGTTNSDDEQTQMVHAPAYAAECGLSALLWAFEDDLFTNSPGSTLHDYAKVIATNR